MVSLSGAISITLLSGDTQVGSGDGGFGMLQVSSEDSVPPRLVEGLR